MPWRVRMRNSTKLSITPETKVGDLLDSYPELEATLLSLSSAFAKLRNPVLRRTVAKVTTLRHAAQVAGISVSKMVNELRAAAGLPETPGEEGAGASPPPDRPVWLRDDRIATRLDIRPLLDRGESPLGNVLTQLGQLQPGGILELTAPFVPAPLIELAGNRKLEAWWRQEDSERVVVYFFSPLQEGADDSLIQLE